VLHCRVVTNVCSKKFPDRNHISSTYFLHIEELRYFIFIGMQLSDVPLLNDLSKLSGLDLLLRHFLIFKFCLAPKQVY